ncbi:MAG: integrase core domain-containing protein, partial [Chloroflexi bacterium]|nr:integrase core domain-containing protein [Chloroflexota bacterium]
PGWTVIHAAIADATRVAYVELLPDECGATASGFLRRMDAHFRRLGIPVQRVLTDNGSQYVSGVGKAACADLGVGARRTRPYRPQTNGKVERWFQTVLRECLPLHPLASEDERQRALDAFVEYSNNDRPHLGIKGLTPLSRLAALSTTLRETTASPDAQDHRAKRGQRHLHRRSRNHCRRTRGREFDPQ